MVSKFVLAVCILTIVGLEMMPVAEGAWRFWKRFQRPKQQQQPQQPQQQQQPHPVQQTGPMTLKNEKCICPAVCDEPNCEDFECTHYRARRDIYRTRIQEGEHSIEAVVLRCCVARSWIYFF